MDGVLLYTCCPLSHPHSTVRFLMNDLPLYFTLTFITILSPGAGVLFTVTSALRSGFQDAWQAPLGNVLASACVAVACAAGIGAILTASPLVFSIVQGLSALVLLYLAWRSWHAPANGFASLADPAAAVHHPSAPPAKQPHGASLFTSAFLLQLTNPMLYVFQVSFLPQFITPSAPYVPQAALLIAIFAGNGIVIHFAYSYAAAWARKFLASPRAAQLINRISALLFCCFGVSVLLKALIGSLIITAARRLPVKIHDRARQNAGSIQKIVHCHVFIRIVRAKPIGNKEHRKGNACRRKIHSIVPGT